MLKANACQNHQCFPITQVHSTRAATIFSTWCSIASIANGCLQILDKMQDQFYNLYRKYHFLLYSYPSKSHRAWIENTVTQAHLTCATLLVTMIMEQSLHGPIIIIQALQCTKQVLAIVLFQVHMCRV